ncbi:hypothetical protein [Cohnella sp. JJ-181]|uniref:hypothetical protein n=1 Tax=Cohnella rhizoplanae TaxID=2974897 RepID=UPI0022FF63E4|nr:hypothetical protein [Cohnella sp. JJ-181]CAI6032166.1 hypothetical protein COHCIP112018_00747 [Cohnella sp. JJ-181]
MSVFKLEAGVYMPIDSRYVGMLEVDIVNRAAKELNVWIQMKGPGGIFSEMLVSVQGGGSSKRLQDMHTNEQPFTLLMIANSKSYDEIGITVRAKRNGDLVAIFTQDHFDRIH